MVCATRALPFSSARLRRSCIRPSIIMRIFAAELLHLGERIAPGTSASSMPMPRRNAARSAISGWRGRCRLRRADSGHDSGGRGWGRASGGVHGQIPGSGGRACRRDVSRLSGTAGAIAELGAAAGPKPKSSSKADGFPAMSGSASRPAGRAGRGRMDRRSRCAAPARPSAASLDTGVATGSRLNGSSKAGELRSLDAARSNAKARNRLLERVRQIGRRGTSRLLFGLGRKEVVAADADRRARCSAGTRSGRRRRRVIERVGRLQIDPDDIVAQSQPHAACEDASNCRRRAGCPASSMNRPLLDVSVTK